MSKNEAEALQNIVREMQMCPRERCNVCDDALASILLLLRGLAQASDTSNTYQR
jgi:hypothetical protein